MPFAQRVPARRSARPREEAQLGGSWRYPLGRTSREAQPMGIRPGKLTLVEPQRHSILEKGVARTRPEAQSSVQNNGPLSNHTSLSADPVRVQQEG